MKKILVAYDGTPGADLAIKDLSRGGFPDRVEAKVASFADVWLPPEPPTDDVARRKQYTETHQKATDLLHEAREIAVNGARHLHQQFPQWTVTNVAHADSPAWGIIAEARRWGANLIVIGSHGRSPLEKFFLGSVSFKVAAEAFCSVRIARPRRNHSHKPPQLLIAVDGSPDAQLAVDEILSRRWITGTEVHLVSVIDAKLKTSLLRQNSETAPATDRAEDWIAPILNEYRSKFAALELNAHTHIFDGDPKSVLLRHAEKWDVDTIFLGSRGLDHGDRLYLGTLASAICTRAHCTVEIVRPPEKQ